jgi:PAS domain S-box-containing protein
MSASGRHVTRADKCPDLTQSADLAQDLMLAFPGQSAGNRMSSDTRAGRSAATNGGIALGVEAAEHERQFREILEFCPAGLLVVDEDGRLLFHNARLREILGYSKDELDLCDTRMHWHDLNQRARIISQLRDQGGQILNEKVIWRTKNGTLVHLLLSYVQVAYHGGHISFVGGKRVLWVYDVTAQAKHEAQVAEQERQLREILDYSPAAVSVVDEDGRLLFHNWRLRELTGYEKEELSELALGSRSVARCPLLAQSRQ